MSGITGGDAIIIEHDILSEQVILGAMVAGWDDGTIDKLLRIFGPDHFSHGEHRQNFEILREMKRRKLGWDAATARQFGGPAYNVTLIEDILNARPRVPENLDFHVQCMLDDRAKFTTLQGPMQALLEGLRDPKADLDRLHAIARQIPATLKGGDRKALYNGRSLAVSQLAQIKSRKNGVKYPFGLDGLDFYETPQAAMESGVLKPEEIAGPDGRVRRMLPGTEPGYITLLSGQSGGGKSTLACALTLSIASQNRKVLYCAWEPKPGLTLETLALQHLGWSRTRCMQGMLTEEEEDKLGATMTEIAGRVVFLDKSPFYDAGGGKKRTNEENLDTFAGYVAESGCDLVIADLWKYVLVSYKPDEEEEALKLQQAMCEDLKFHLILLQQHAHKRNDMRPDRKPSREGVKGSGAYLEIADNFIAPHIPSLWKPGFRADRFELYVLKQRYGRAPLGIEFGWDPNSGRLSGGRSIPYESGGQRGQDRDRPDDERESKFTQPKRPKYGQE